MASSSTGFVLPPVLPSAPAYDHKDEEVSTEVGRVTTPAETPIFICVIDNCNRLFPSRDRLAQHRKAIHNSTDVQNDVITWNED